MAEREIFVAGEKFGELTFLGDSESQSSKPRRALFRCFCGKTFESRISHVKGGKTVSCGCHRRSKTVERNISHGDAHRGKVTPEYRAWQEMKKRCEWDQHAHFSNYGGRGIRVCDAWQDFSAFLAEMGRRPSPSHSIDRIDVDGNYEVGNCRWATDIEQSNNRRTTFSVEYRGLTKPLADWARELGLQYHTLHRRLTKYGWSVERAFSTPPVIGRNQFG